MPSLSETQAALRSALLSGDAGAVCALFDADAGRVAQALAVHHGTRAQTLAQALYLAFPGVRAVLGDAGFRTLAARFVAQQHARSGWLERYGGGFADFLREQPQAGEVAAGLAAIDYGVNQALHAEAVPTRPAGCRPLAALGGLDERGLAQVRLRPHPGLTLLVVPGEAERLWRAAVLQEPAPDAAVPALARLCIFPSPEGVRVQSLAAAVWTFTQAVCAGTPLAAAATAFGGDPLALGTVLGGQFGDGLYLGFEPAQPQQEDEP